MKSTDPILTSRLKARALELGADLVGIAAVERYEHAPPQMTPTAHLPSAQAVVVIAIHHPDAAIELGGEPTPHDQGPYAIQGTMNDKLEHISFWLARLLEAEGHRVVALPATNVWRFRPYKDNPTPFAPDLSNIHAAAAAGLGEIGWSGLLLTPEFGPRQRFCCLVTDAPLEPSPLYSGPPLCDRCHVCVQVCPTEAFTQEVAGESVVRIGERTFTYANKNKWRCAWAEHFGLHLDLPKPEKIDEQVILATLAKHGRYAGEMGSCLRYCLPPHLRVKDPAYTRVWRRRRPGLEVGEPEARDGEPGLDRRTTEQVKRLAFESGADLVAIARREQFETTDLRDYLPDARSVVVFAAHYPETLAHPDDPAWPSERVGAVLQRKLDFLQLDLCRLLEERGYSALPKSGFPEEVAAEVAGLAEREASGRLRTPEYGLRQQTACVLTSAPLAPGRWAGRPARLPRPTAPQDWAAATEELAGFLRQRGADLVGVAPVERFDSLVEGLRLVIDEEALGLEVRDAGGPHGPVIPQIELGEARVLHPNDHLPGARTVLVLGLHYPAQNLVRATEPPAEAAGPYAYATYQTLRELEMLAHEAMRYLEAWGCRAVPTADLLGTASVVASPRGYLPDATANALAAVAAGLGELGWHGLVLTPEFGVAQRFCAVVTDAPLTPSPLYEGPPLCRRCWKCLSACPVQALGREQKVELRLEGRPLVFARLDRRRCDWAKKYALVGAEGPAYMGATTDVPPPEGPITAEAIAAALAQKDPLQKHWTCIVEPCLRACYLASVTTQPEADIPASPEDRGLGTGDRSSVSGLPSQFTTIILTGIFIPVNHVEPAE